VSRVYSSERATTRYSSERVACPRCKEEGRDSGNDHLRPFADNPGRGYCYHGHGVVSLDGGSLKSKNFNGYTPRDASLDLAAISSYPIRALTHKPIPREIAEKFGVRVAVSEMDGTTIESVFYPYHDADGNICGYKKRRLPKDFSVTGKLKGLFGQKACKENAKMLCIFEGEDDALSAATMFAERGKNYNVVSIPSGANEEGVIDQGVRRELEWIVKHETVLLCYDMDGPGQKTAKSMAELLASQTKVGIVSLPLKDAGEMLKAGRTADFFNAIFGSKQYRPEEIIEGSAIRLEDLKKPKEPGVELPFPKLQKMTWGLRKGEITLVTAGTGIGKSSFVREIAYDLATKGYTVANIALETVMEDSARYYVAMDNNIPAYKLMFNPHAISDQAYQRSYDKFFKTNKMHFFKHWGSLASEKLIQQCYYFVKVLGVDFIQLDHISMVIAGTESSNERKDIDVLFEGLTRLVTETGVGVLAVMHLKRVQGKSFNKGGEVELTDLRGSAGAEQMSMNIWALERDQQGDNKDMSRIRVLKSRLLGFTGLADNCIYHHDTGRLLPFETQDY
jgi:twinkle protein